MTTKKFSSALGDINESYLNEAISYTAKKKSGLWVKWVVIAACLSLMIVTVVLGAMLFKPDAPDESVLPTDVPPFPDESALPTDAPNITDDVDPPTFVIKTLSSSGAPIELGLRESCFNSVDLPENMFGVDMPLFSFSVRPYGSNSIKDVYSHYDIFVSYNNVKVEGQDEHINVAYVTPMPDSKESGYYSVSGWFTEPTEITVKIINKYTKNIVDWIIVKVSYLESMEEYELEIVNISDIERDQAVAVAASEALMRYFFNQGYVTDYPSYYGGRYIKDNKLYVRLVSPTEAEKAKLSSIFAPYKESVVYQYSDMSMNDLQEYADKIFIRLREEGYKVAGYGVDDITGDIVIGVLKEDVEAATAWVKANLRVYPKVVIEEGGYVELD